MKKIAETESFANFTREGYIYVDKTEYIYNLVSLHERVFFSRPRRFGKSLTLNTIGTLFEQGVEPYFKGTWVYDKWDLGTFEVLRLNFLDYSVTDLIEFKRSLCQAINTFARRVGLDVLDDPQPNNLINNLFAALMTKNQQIVILIDEYDRPLSANINNAKLYEEFRITIQDFYAAIKGKDPVKFLAVTGVTRLKDVSIFSVGSDIKDLTFHHAFAQMIGFTREEIKHFYTDYLRLGVSYEKDVRPEEATEEQIDDLLDRMAQHYDGYCFDEFHEDFVFSTWSVNNFLSDLYSRKRLIFGSYWYDVGGLPSILVNYLKSHDLDLLALLNDEVRTPYEDFTNPTSLPGMNQSVLMCQTGYLTLRSRLEPRPRYVKLGFANLECAAALSSLVSYKVFARDVDINNDDGRNILASGECDAIMDKLNEIAAALPYDRYPIDSEAVLRGLFLFYFIGCLSDGVEAERHNSHGRSDILLDMDRRRLVLEFKLSPDGSDAARLLKEAVLQIERNDYGRENLKGRELLRLAAVFDASPAKRCFTLWQMV
ncbi:MAG: AAA family ATPase [Succinivibrio sp.]|nr:AAA family ATPase [Succinivibrio sp.]